MIGVVLTGGKKMSFFGFILAFIDVEHIFVGLKLVGRVVWARYFFIRILLNVVTKHNKLFVFSYFHYLFYLFASDNRGP